MCVKQADFNGKPEGIDGGIEVEFLPLKARHCTDSGALTVSVCVCVCVCVPDHCASLRRGCVVMKGDVFPIQCFI
jgi:hypothetical protein